MNAPDCIRCRHTMEVGFLLESGDERGGRRATRWVAGVPERSFWTGVKTGDRPVIDVATFRCPKCGYLESYATA